MSSRPHYPEHAGSTNIWTNTVCAHSLSVNWMRHVIILTFAVSSLMDIHQFNHNHHYHWAKKEDSFFFSLPAGRSQQDCSEIFITVLPVNGTSLTAPCSEWRSVRRAVGWWHHRCTPGCLGEPGQCAGRSEGEASGCWIQNYWSAQQGLCGNNKWSNVVISVLKLEYWIKTK